MKAGSDAFMLPDGVRNITHPADDARMRALLQALKGSGFQAEAARIGTLRAPGDGDHLFRLMATSRSD
jgi:hypothetical protein